MLEKIRIPAVVILFLLGLFFLFYNQISGIIYENWLAKNQGEVLAEMTKESIEENKKNLNEEEKFDYSSIENINSGMGMPKIDPSRMNNAIGIISIPAVDLEEPIFYGTTNENLWLGATTMKPDQKMGEGNYTLAGHNHHTRSILFQPIRNVEDGDEIFITDKDKVYTYKVVDKKVVMPERVEVLDDVPGKEIVTLVSCFSKDGSDRIIVTGELSNVANFED